MKSVDTLAHTLALWHNQLSSEPIPQACTEDEIAFAEAAFTGSITALSREPERIYRRSTAEFGGFCRSGRSS